MKKLLAAGVALVLIGILLLFWVANNHIIRADEGTIVINKRFVTLKDSFVDIREWTSSDFDAHPALKIALIEEGYGDMLAELKREEMKASLQDLFERADSMAQEMMDEIQKEVDGWLKEEQTPPEEEPYAL